MDQHAIKQVQQSAHIPEILKQVADTKVPVCFIPGDMNIASLEKYMPNAARYRGRFKTDSIKDFIAYNLGNRQEGATCFIEQSRMKAQTIFDLGTNSEPGHKEHTASLTLEKTAPFKALLDIDGVRLPQKDVANFFEDWQDFIITHDGKGKENSALPAARQIRDLTIDMGRELSSKIDNMGYKMSAQEKVEARNKEKLPATVRFTCDPYTGLSNQDFNLTLNILSDGKTLPEVMLRIIGKDAIEEKIAEEFKDVLSALNGDIDSYEHEVAISPNDHHRIKIYLGTYA